MEEPERKYNVRAWVIIFVIGSLVGATVVSGLIVHLSIWFLDLSLPRGNWGIPPLVFQVVCPVGFWGTLVGGGILIWRFLRRPRGDPREHESKRARLDALMAGHDETTATREE